MLKNLANWWGKLFEGKKASAKSGHLGREVAIAVFALDELDLAACRRLITGQELELTAQGQAQVLILRQGRRLGQVPAQEATGVASLLAQGAKLGCRVVGLSGDGQAQVVRVRVSILM